MRLSVHWRWVCVACRSLFGLRPVQSHRRGIYGALLLMLLIAMMILLLCWARTQVR